MPVRPEQAAALSPARAECEVLHHRQVEIDAGHNGDNRECAHQRKEIAPALAHPHADMQDMHRMHELLHSREAVNAVPAVKDAARAHIIHDLFAAHAHMGARRLSAAVLDEEVERPV